MIRKLEYITCPAGDWEIIKLDDEVFFEGHSLPTEEAINLIAELLPRRVEIIRREVSDEDMEYGIYD